MTLKTAETSDRIDETAPGSAPSGIGIVPSVVSSAGGGSGSGMGMVPSPDCEKAGAASRHTTASERTNLIEVSPVKAGANRQPTLGIVTGGRADDGTAYVELFDAGRYTEARLLALANLTRDPGSPEWLHAAALTTLLLGDPPASYALALQAATPDSKPELSGKIQNTLGMAGQLIGGAFLPRALWHFQTAGGHFVKASRFDYATMVENNRAMLLMDMGRYSEAHEVLDHASESASDALKGELTDTRGRIYKAEGKIEEAMDCADLAVYLCRKFGSKRAWDEAEKFRASLVRR